MAVQSKNPTDDIGLSRVQQLFVYAKVLPFSDIVVNFVNKVCNGL